MALRHHPDKALASVKIVLLLGEEAGCAVAAASDFEARLRQEANFVFNLINAAHEELGDKVKRRKVGRDVGRAVTAPPCCWLFVACFHSTLHEAAF